MLGHHPRKRGEIRTPATFTSADRRVPAAQMPGSSAPCYNWRSAPDSEDVPATLVAEVLLRNDQVANTSIKGMSDGLDM